MNREPDYLESLNPEQRAAVEHFEGPLLVLAGAGSGKTRVLTTRVAHLIREHGVDQGAILAVTFTNKAAGEMRDRIRQLLGHEPAGSWIGTFHSIGARLLRRHALQLGGTRNGPMTGSDSGRALPGWSSNFSIYDADAAQREVKRVLEQLKFSTKQWHPKAVQAAISSAKNQFVDPAVYADSARDPFTRVVAEVYPLYQAALREQNAFDFDDLLVKPVELFRTRPAVLAEYRARFPFILVDEYQDTNHVQYRLIKLLALGYDEAPGQDGPPGADLDGMGAAPPANLMVVGDDDQSIYGWRGADIRNILDFEKDFPDAAVIRLEQNYRSTSRILEAANHVIAENVHRKGKSLRTEIGPGELLTEVAAADEADEADWIVTEIGRRRLDDPELSLRDFVVLYRTNAQSRALEDACLRHGLPYQIVGGTRFYERREIMDLLAYLRLISNPRDGGAFDRIVNYPRRGVGETTKARLQSWATAQGVSLLEAASAATEVEGVTRGAAAALIAFSDLIGRYRELAQNLGVGELLEKLAEEVGIYEALSAEGPEGVDRIANVEELVASAYGFDADEAAAVAELPVGSTALDLFLQQVSLIADVDRHDAGADAITLMTLHNAKGLEFPYVFIAGLEEGLFPLSRAFDETGALEEERRLFYVGITRARQKLYLLYAHTRRRLGTIQDSLPSSFLGSIPSELLEKRSTPRLMRGFGGSGRWQHSWPPADWGGEARGARSTRSGVGRGSRSGRGDGPEDGGGLVVDYSEGQDLPRFIKGEVVRHAQFGRGTIRELSGSGLSLKAVIEFEGVGRKTVVVRYANLQKEL